VVKVVVTNKVKICAVDAGGRDSLDNVPHIKVSSIPYDNDRVIIQINTLWGEGVKYTVFAQDLITAIKGAYERLQNFD
jgi:hypothetical protein